MIFPIVGGISFEMGIKSYLTEFIQDEFAHHVRHLLADAEVRQRNIRP